MESWREELEDKLIVLCSRMSVYTILDARRTVNPSKRDLQLRKLQRKLMLPVCTSQYVCLSTHELICFKL